MTEQALQDALILVGTVFVVVSAIALLTVSMALALRVLDWSLNKIFVSFCRLSTNTYYFTYFVRFLWIARRRHMDRKGRRRPKVKPLI